jgi:hypothetical protein
MYLTKTTKKVWKMEDVIINRVENGYIVIVDRSSRTGNPGKEFVFDTSGKVSDWIGSYLQGKEPTTTNATDATDGG